MPRLKFIHTGIILSFVMLALSACNMSISGDVTPPPGSELLIEKSGTSTFEASTVAEEQTETQAVSNSSPITNVVFYGKVTNLSGGEAPADLSISLQNYTGTENDILQTTLLDESGSYRFSPVDAENNQMYIVTVEYKGIIFSSDIIDGSSLNTSENLSVDVGVYENTTSLTGVYIDRVHLFLSPVSDGQIRVIVYLLISNPTQYVITSPDGEPVLTFTLPEKATNLQWDDSGLDTRFITLKNGFGDRLSIFPGIQEHEILYSFDLPYDGETQFSLTFPLFEQNGTLIVPEGYIAQGDGLSEAGQREMDNSIVQLYDIASLDENQPLEFTLSGKGDITSKKISWVVVLIGSIVLILAVAVSFILLKRKNGNRESIQLPFREKVRPETQDVILDAIIELGRKFEDGLIPEQEYMDQRQQLKSKLKEIRNI